MKNISMATVHERKKIESSDGKKWNGSKRSLRVNNAWSVLVLSLPFRRVEWSAFVGRKDKNRSRTTGTRVGRGGGLVLLPYIR